MRYRWSALVLVLALVLMPRVGQSQSASATQPAPAAKLRQNYPNPFNPETGGGFEVLGTPSCPDGGKLHRVTLKIYNILMQEVAVPVLQGGVGGVAGNTALDNVLLPCGEWKWHWNGFYGRGQLGTREAASGIYILIQTVDGRKSEPLKMTVRK